MKTIGAITLILFLGALYILDSESHPKQPAGEVELDGDLFVVPVHADSLNREVRP